MDTIIYIVLLLMVLLSGLFAISPIDTKDKGKDKQETIIEKIGITDPAGLKKQFYSRLIALTVFTMSLASIMAMYFIKG